MKKFISLFVAFICLIAFASTAFAAGNPTTSYTPTTNTPIVLDYNKAVLLATAKATGSERGFYYWTTDKKTNVISKKIVKSKMNVLITGLKPETTYYVQSYVKKGKTVYTGKTLQFTTPAKKNWSVNDPIFAASNDRYKFIFGNTRKYFKTSAPPWGYNGASEAKKHMTTITVPVWKLTNGKKVAGTMKLTIHSKLKENVKAIFNEIYALSIKFPITYLTGFSYRRMVVPWVKDNPYLSQHSFGTCIDINRYQNGFYRYKDKRNKKSPYYIPNSVIAIFEKYGWTWGGDFKEGLDTMHFQYLGPELMG